MWCLPEPKQRGGAGVAGCNGVIDERCGAFRSIQRDGVGCPVPWSPFLSGLDDQPLAGALEFGCAPEHVWVGGSEVQEGALHWPDQVRSLTPHARLGSAVPGVATAFTAIVIGFSGVGCGGVHPAGRAGRLGDISDRNGCLSTGVRDLPVVGQQSPERSCGARAKGRGISKSSERDRVVTRMRPAWAAARISSCCALAGRVSVWFA